MEREEEYRVIPGYESYGVTNSGTIKSLVRDLILSQYILDGYLIVDAFRGSLTETLPVHRAVALAWVPNPNPDLFNLVNHDDGNKLNNWASNLEWTNYSGNNYHAVNTGLRSDNINCRIRSFTTGQIHEFSSLAQAAEFMGMRKDTSIYQLNPKMFGKLIAGEYELRFAGDSAPWFYETRTKRIRPSRYMVIVKDSDGNEEEIYSTMVLLQKYGLYGSSGKSIPCLADHGNKIYPDKEFIVRDSYAEPKFRTTRQTKESRAIEIMAQRFQDILHFDSLTQAAKHFNVDRSSITNRLNNDKNLDGWTFTQCLTS